MSDAILAAAYRVYVAEGIDAVSMRRLAAEVGVTAPALYKHYEGKDALVEAIAELGFARFEQTLPGATEARGPRARIRRVLDAYCEFAIDEPHLFDIMFVSPRVRLRRFPADFASKRSNAFNMLRAAVDAGIEQELFAPDDSLGVTLDLWALAHGFVGLYRAGRFGNDADAMRAAFRKALVRLMRGLQRRQAGKGSP
jgi:AcrR family transcriptional regulator